MVAKLASNASGTRHVRWARAILATADAHLQHNYLLTPDQRGALGAELSVVRPLFDALVAKVAPYRDFVELAYVDVRAKQRVADYLCDEAQRNADGGLRPRRKDIDDALKKDGGFAAILSKSPLSRVLRAGREKTVQFARTAATLIGSLPKTIPAKDDLSTALTRAADLLHGFNQEQDEVIEPQRLPLRSAVNAAIYELREGLEKMDGRLRTHFAQDFIDSLYPELNKKGTAVASEEDETEDDAAPSDAESAKKAEGAKDAGADPAKEAAAAHDQSG
jgi:hypothetical protein